MNAKFIAARLADQACPPLAVHESRRVRDQAERDQGRQRRQLGWDPSGVRREQESVVVRFQHVEHAVRAIAHCAADGGDQRSLDTARSSSADPKQSGATGVRR